MTELNKEELRRLAEAAPAGPWFGPEYAPGTSYVFDVDLGMLLHYESIDTEQEQCLRYVAAANPSAVLSLLDENDQLRAEVKALRKKAGKYATIERVMKMLECDEREGGIWTACTLLLIGSAHKMNSARSVVDQEGVTVSGHNLGDWRVTVERISATGKEDITK